MKTNTYKTIGIIGGVGPEATLDLYRFIVKLTPARRDQDHLPTLIYSLPQIPDRTQALLYGGEDPLPYLVKAGKTLEQAGADFIIIPCNTAHAFTDKLQDCLAIPIINMIEQTAEYVRINLPKVKTVGLLATTGTVKSKIYHRVFAQHKLQLVTPTSKTQQLKVMAAIYGQEGIKAGFTGKKPKRLLHQAARELLDQGAQAIIMGCTEIPLVLKDKTANYQLINPTEILAQAAIKAALPLSMPKK